jgi:hypothetical protein
MSAKSGTPGARQQRLTSYLDRLTAAAGHADRTVPLRLYCTGLLLAGEGKSVEPMAARLAPENVRRMHQSLHHVVADAAWSDEALLGCTRDYALAAMTKTSPVDESPYRCRMPGRPARFPGEFRLQWLDGSGQARSPAWSEKQCRASWLSMWPLTG